SWGSRCSLPSSTGPGGRRRSSGRASGPSRAGPAADADLPRPPAQATAPVRWTLGAGAGGAGSMRAIVRMSGHAPRGPSALDGAQGAPDSSYLRLLLVLLSTATFFEGYDSAISGVVLNELARDFHAGTGELSWVV